MFSTSLEGRGKEKKRGHIQIKYVEVREEMEEVEAMEEEGQNINPKETPKVLITKREV